MQDRPRLLDRLTGAPGARLILLTAPAGFGKTQLLRAWTATRTEPVAWLSLEAWDNDPTQWFAAIAKALSAAGLNPAPAYPTPVTLLDQLNRACTLVLDNFHQITAPSILQGLNYLLDHLPPGVRIAIASRTVPRLALARLQMQNTLLRLEAADLAFTAAEALQLLPGAPPSEVQRLTATTGGWPGALQLIALSKQSTDQIRSRRDLAAFMRDEVLSHQPEPWRRFLAKTALLDRLSAPLCEAITGEDGAQSLLMELESAGLISPLGDGWYQMQPLLRDLLRAEQRPRPEFDRLAAAWYLSAGMAHQAVEHAGRGQDPDLLRTIVERFGQSLWLRGEVATLTEWLKRIPNADQLTSPQLSLLRGWTLVHGGEATEAEIWAKQAEADPSARGEAAAIRARAAALQGDLPQTLRWSRRALTLLPEHERTLRSDLYLNIGHAQTHRSLKAAADGFARAARLAEEAGHPRTALFALRYLSGVRASQGRLREAVTILADGLERAVGAGWADLPAAGALHVAAAHLHYEQNRLTEALAEAERGLLLGERGGEAKILVSGYLTRARIHAALQQRAQALADLRRMERAAGAHLPATGRAQVLLSLGDLPGVIAWLREIELGPESRLTAERVPAFLVLLQVLRLTGRPAEALQLAQRLIDLVEPSGDRWRLLRLKVQLALTQSAIGQGQEAANTLGELLAEARPEGWVRTFLDGGKEMAALLERASIPSECIEYRQRLHSLISPDLSEGLTPREEEVLRLLAAGCSNQELAQRLFVSVGTVKTHVHRIYQKLGVSSRTQAVAGARTLGLLERESILR